MLRCTILTLKGHCEDWLYSSEMFVDCKSPIRQNVSVNQLSGCQMQTNLLQTKYTLSRQPMDYIFCLSFQVPWPVDVVISGRCEQIYNDVFTFILQVNFPHWHRLSLSGVGHWKSCLAGLACLAVFTISEIFELLLIFMNTTRKYRNA